MEEDKVKGYYYIYKWMFDELGLRCRTVHAYAVIYNYTRNGLTWHGSCRELAERIGSTRCWTNRILADLERRGLIKRVGKRRGIPEYIAIRPGEGCAETER
ncbi:MAG: helix-turn-helix domain-containing protein [Clostridia bacterium]|jgi:DNA-binding MarR family transcriptional regulator|nr:helix-turn-helix domain-containing protein [Clostridia bacterium]